MNADKRSIKTFKNLIYEVQIPKKSLIIGLLGTVMTTVFALIIPLFVRSLVDGMSTFRWGISTFFS